MVGHGFDWVKMGGNGWEKEGNGVELCKMCGEWRGMVENGKEWWEMGGNGWEKRGLVWNCGICVENEWGIGGICGERVVMGENCVGNGWEL